MVLFFFSSRRRHTRCSRDWSSDVCSSDLADGQEAAAKAAYDSLQRSGPPRDPFSEQLRALFRVGLACRFDGSAACRHALDQTLPGAGSYPDLAAGPRYLMTFDAPWGAIEFGRRFAALRDQPELARSGLVAQVSGYVALGLADSARAAARELRGGGPELNVFAPELDGALLLVDADCAEGDARWAELSRTLAEHARSRASTDEIGRACVGKECRSRWSPYHSKKKR